MKWETVELKDICKIKSGKRLPKGSKFSKVITPYPYIRARDIKNGVIDSENLVYITESDKKYISKYIVNANDIVITIVGASVGDVAYVKKEFDGFNLTENAVRLTEFLPSVNAYFVFNILNTDVYWNLMQQIAGGSAQPKLGIYKIETIPINLPPLSIQNKIVSILSAYDDLIENNHKQIKLLEEAAQRLYKEWFIDLRFPGHEQVKIVDGVPEGWKESTIFDLCLKINAGGTPNRNNLNYWNNGNVKWYKTGELQDCWLLDSEEHISQEGLNFSSAKLFPKHTILMAIYASPTLGRLGILSSDAACNQAALCLIADEKKISWQWLYFKLFELRDEFNAIAKGAGQQNISADIVKKTLVVYPDYGLINSFTEISDKFFVKIYNLQKQNNLLKEARDRLLPKLMSGEIEV